MKYIPRTKGFKLGLYNENGIAPSLPKNIKVRFDTSADVASFQFFDGKKAISPELVKLEDNRGFSFVATLKSGLLVDIDVERQSIGNPYLGRIENIYIGENGEVSFNSKMYKPEPYVLDKKSFKTPFENGYLLQSLVGVKNASGRCAILDAYSKKFITDFVLDSNNYEIADVINLETNSPFRSYYIVKTNVDGMENGLKYLHKFIIVSQDGMFLDELNAIKILWNEKNEEKQPDGRVKEYSYVAFADIDDKKNLKTKVLKIDIELGKVVQAIEVPLIADMSLQNNNELIFASDGRLVLITASPEIMQSKGAYAVDLSGNVETLLNNKNTAIEYTHDYKKGDFLTYRNPESVGKVALSKKARTFDVSKSEFVNLANKYFGSANATGVRQKLGQIEMPSDAGKKEPVKRNAESSHATFGEG